MAGKQGSPKDERPAAAANLERTHRSVQWPRGALYAVSHLPGVYHAATLLMATRYVVEGESMQPLLSAGQHILVHRLAYRLVRPSRGDVAIFRDPSKPARHCVKRIVGLPGEHVHIAKGQVLVDGRPLPEPYVSSNVPSPTLLPNQWVLEADQFFVLGDNRRDSHDSRTFGPVHQSDIVGRLWLTYWPPRGWNKRR